jgi:excisionase family DNA binding protein
MQAQMLTTKQVAERFAVNPQTVITWANDGKLPHFRTLGGHRRYRLADVEQLLAAARVETADGAA